MVRTYFHSSIAHLERFVQDGEFSWTVNSCGHFLMVITNGGNAGCVGANPLLGSANTVQCQVRGCGGKAPARKSSYFVSTSVRVRLDQVWVWVRFGLG